MCTDPTQLDRIICRCTRLIRNKTVPATFSITTLHHVRDQSNTKLTDKSVNALPSSTDLEKKKKGKRKIFIDEKEKDHMIYWFEPVTLVWFVKFHFRSFTLTCRCWLAKNQHPQITCIFHFYHSVHSWKKKISHFKAFTPHLFTDWVKDSYSHLN